MQETTPLAETSNYIVLDEYERLPRTSGSYQSEAQLEDELIADLIQQGYSYARHIKDPRSLLSNAREQLERLNETHFSDSEWKRFCQEYLDNPNDDATAKAQKIHQNHIYTFTFDDGHMQNIRLVDKKLLSRNSVQVINQLEQTGKQVNRYDVTILVNGLPLVHIELKRRGVALREAFNQIHRYSKESFNAEESLYKYVQLFVISNGTDTRYFANTTRREKNSFDFTMHWAEADNTPIKDLKDFTATFLQRKTLLEVLLVYSVLDVTNTLLVMRPYQIAATERLLWKIRSSYIAKRWSCPEGGGYIWHTTGSGKTLTSFKAAQLATELEFIDKVFFVVDRKDLDYQTMKEYQRFDKDSVLGSNDTAGLKSNIQQKDQRIIVTTLQKLTLLMKREPSLAVYQQQVIFIFDEAHRSQFGESQKLLRKRFKRYYEFGFTGTPIFAENATGDETTASLFGEQLHSYVITDAIRDEKVLKFKVDYNDVRPKFREAEGEEGEVQLDSADYQRLMLHPERLRQITTYILDNFARKTHRQLGSKQGFNALFAVSSIEAARLYYEEFKRQQEGVDRPLKVATIFSYAANEEQSALGELADESFETSGLELSGKEFLQRAIEDYNHYFSTSFSVDASGFQNYYRDLAQRVRDQEVDLLIVVGMFLTGFDAPRLNTLFVDKSLRYHGLIQAYSRTNRIYDATKTFGNVITFRDLEDATIDALKLFGNQYTRSVVLEHKYEEYVEGFDDEESGAHQRGYREVVEELRECFPDPSTLETDEEKRQFVTLFSEYLRLENILQNYDEFALRKELEQLPEDASHEREALALRYGISPEELTELLAQPLLEERENQDYRSVYNDIREWLRQQRKSKDQEESLVAWDGITFEVDLLKSQEVNLDYLLELVFERLKETGDKEALIIEVRRILRASIDQRAKEGLVVDFIQQLDLDSIEDKADLLDAFYSYARGIQQKEVEFLISEENLNDQEARRYIQKSVEREYASELGTDLRNILPKMSPLNKRYSEVKERVLEKIRNFVNKFKGIGGEL